MHWLRDIRFRDLGIFNTTASGSSERCSFILLKKSAGSNCIRLFAQTVPFSGSGLIPVINIEPGPGHPTFTQSDNAPVGVCHLWYSVLKLNEFPSMMVFPQFSTKGFRIFKFVHDLKCLGPL